MEAIWPDAWMDFRPEQAFAPSHCDAWTEVVMFTIRMMTMLISRWMEVHEPTIG